jgi:hypothetical protein
MLIGIDARRAPKRVAKSTVKTEVASPPESLPMITSPTSSSNATITTSFVMPDHEDTQSTTEVVADVPGLYHDASPSSTTNSNTSTPTLPGLHLYRLSEQLMQAAVRDTGLTRRSMDDYDDTSVTHVSPATTLEVHQPLSVLYGSIPISSSSLFAATPPSISSSRCTAKVASPDDNDLMATTTEMIGRETNGLSSVSATSSFDTPTLKSPTSSLNDMAVSQGTVARELGTHPQ